MKQESLSTHAHGGGHNGHSHDHDHAHPHEHVPATSKPIAATATSACGTGCCAPFSINEPAKSQAHDEGDGHDHAHDHGVLPGWPRIYAALAAALAAEACHWFGGDDANSTLQYLGMALAVLGIALSGLGVYKAGLKDLLRFKLGIHALMAVAVTGAFIIGQWPEAAMVMALYAAAERIEDQAMDKARLAIRNLLQLAPETADVLQPDGSTVRMAANEVPLGAVLRVTPGARVPLDGLVTEGESSVNQAPITGESALAHKGPGDELYAGSINQDGELHLRVTAPASDSLIARIVHAVEQAQSSKAPTQRFVDRFAEVYTPIVLVLAIALGLLAPWLLNWSWHQAAYQALALLVIACPCALVLSTPVTVVSALTAAAKRGILIKGGSALESARQLKAIALDKTGTLTTGSPKLVDWQGWNAASSDEAAARAYALASRSDHPVSRAIAQGLEEQTGKELATAQASAQQLQALPGRGVQAQIDGERWTLANLRWVGEQGWDSAELKAALMLQEQQGRTVTLLANEQGVQALFAVADPLRPQAKAAVAQLQALGVKPIVLSGDNSATVRTVAAEAGISDARGNMLPEDKLKTLSELQRDIGPTAMTGDGINDAPALAQADIGFAMGGMHATDMAMETADVVLMNDDLRRIPEVVDLSQRAHSVLWQNISLALGIKLAFFILAVSGNASMWLAVLADMGVSLLVVANGLRLRHWGNRPENT
ncbi:MULTISPECIES: heavy metal translocating P-type ATPase [Comamonas]|uniref:heavy metal translocating P-type ATPase n=1 Tax=Comamonas TaxID=283 RepID=UPI00050F5BC8|nr:MULTISPECIES: cation-translocating P-type ATPase [Comamonas]KGG87606.1 ATPase P [Comamonas thiooxydans]KGG88802.1 ATPase P [Comamonas thiooxydans]KGG99959.1 ATPase P [Comamonas thiooxydans]KGH01492.1 ATPase P [Comamonas thiooxydans]KGH09800.1 ATPase P [Comamonas thiooxydans]